MASLHPARSIVVKTALAALCFFVLAGSCYAAIALPAYWHRQLETETYQLSILKNEVDVLLESAEQAALLQSRSELKRELQLSAKPVHEYVLLVRQTAAYHRLQLDLITADQAGSLLIKGRGRAVNEIASFTTALEELPGLTAVRVVSISLGQDKDYLFDIEAAWAEKGGAD